MVLVNIIDVATAACNRKREGYKEKRACSYIFTTKIHPSIHPQQQPFSMVWPLFYKWRQSVCGVGWLVVLWCWWWWLKMQQKKWSFIAYTQEAKAEREKQTPPNPTTKYSIVPRVLHITEQSWQNRRANRKHIIFLHYNIMPLCYIDMLPISIPLPFMLLALAGFILC